MNDRVSEDWLARYSPREWLRAADWRPADGGTEQALLFARNGHKHDRRVKTPL